VTLGKTMARGRNSDDLTTLQMALVGYQIEKQKIEDKIQQIQAQLRGKKGSSSTPEKPAGTRRVLSPEARKRIAAAQKKRWAEHRRMKAQQA
jgi:cell division septum initiation protein DivIVA